MEFPDQDDTLSDQVRIKMTAAPLGPRSHGFHTLLSFLCFFPLMFSFIFTYFIIYSVLSYIFLYLSIFSFCLSLCYNLFMSISFFSSCFPFFSHFFILPYVFYYISIFFFCFSFCYILFLSLSFLSLCFPLFSLLSSILNDRRKITWKRGLVLVRTYYYGIATWAPVMVLQPKVTLETSQHNRHE